MECFLGQLLFFYQEGDAEKEIKEIFSGRRPKWGVPGAHSRGLEIKIQMRQFSTGGSRARGSKTQKFYDDLFFG